jgi:hypothetical protein
MVSCERDPVSAERSPTGSRFFRGIMTEEELLKDEKFLAKGTIPAKETWDEVPSEIIILQIKWILEHFDFDRVKKLDPRYNKFSPNQLRINAGDLLWEASKVPNSKCPGHVSGFGFEAIKWVGGTLSLRLKLFDTSSIIVRKNYEVKIVIKNRVQGRELDI